MRLYYSATSPFVRKVRMVLIETGQEGSVAFESVKTTPISSAAALQAANPLGKIPALERDDGPTLYDSRVICEYLNARVDGRLYDAGWDSKVLEATGDGIAEAAVLAAYERRLRPEGMVWEAWIAAQMEKVRGGCAALNARWMSHLQGPMDIGQISVAAALAYVDFRHAETDWRRGNDALAGWFAEFESRPAFQATRPT